MLPLAFEVNNFFPFRETLFTVELVVFFNREEQLCSSLLQESTDFFVSAKVCFACVCLISFLSSRRGKLPQRARHAAHPAGALF